jgi:hypothetical protein
LGDHIVERVAAAFFLKPLYLCTPLFPQAFAAGTIVFEAQGRFADESSCWLKCNLFPFEISLEGIKEETIVRYGEPR